MTEFAIIGEYIQLNQFLKATGIAVTGGHAKILIEDGEVMVNNEVEYRLRNKLRPGFVVKVGEEEVTIIEGKEKKP